MGNGLGPLEAVLLGGVLLLVVPFLFFVKELETAFRRCTPASRKMDAGRVWLLLVPVFNYVWQLVVVFALAKSLEVEFTRRAWQVSDLEVLKMLGWAMSICILALPLWGGVSLIPAALLWAVYWWQLRGVSLRLKNATTAGLVSS